MTSVPPKAFTKPDYRPRLLGPCSVCGKWGVIPSDPHLLCLNCLIERYGVALPNGVTPIVDYSHVTPDGFWFDWIGFAIEERPSDNRQVATFDDTGELVEIRLMRAFCDGCTFAIVYHRHADGSHRVVYEPADPNAVPTDGDARSLRRLRQFMQHRVAALPGRSARDSEEDAAEIVAVMKKLLANGYNPSQARVAANMYPAANDPRDSLKSRLSRLQERSGLTWKDLLARSQQ
jgi:hypothetical protein